MYTNKKKRDSFPLGLWLDLYELAMAQVYFVYRRQQKAVFELFIRSEKRPFYLVAGIREAAEYAANLRFSSSAIKYLNSLGLFRDDFLSFLKRFRFSGDIYGLSEGEIAFANEPLMRVEADIIEAQIVESALLNIVNLNTTLATKALRVVLAAGERPVYDFSLRRTQGRDASLAAARNSFIAGAKGTSNVLAGFIYNIPVIGTMAHSFVMSFKEELDSFRTFWEMFPQNAILLVDTYSIEAGIKNVIRLAKFVSKIKGKVLGVRIDSGDLVQESKKVRRLLDEAGLVDTIIVASGNLDEYKIKDLTDKMAPIDAFGVGTNMGTSADLPFSDVVYKIVETSSFGGEVLPLMKLSPAKVILPGSKSLGRKFSRAGSKMEFDYLASSSEKLKGKPLLNKLVSHGKIILPPPKSLHLLQAEVARRVKTLPVQLKKLDSGYKYELKVSPGLEKLGRNTAILIKKRLSRQNILFFDIDTQYDFVHPRGCLYVKGAEKLRARWQALTVLALRKKIRIVSSLDSHKKNDKEFKRFPPNCIEGSKGQEKIKGTILERSFILENKVYSRPELFKIKENYHQIIIKKHTFDVFSNPNTKILIDMFMPEEVYLYGVAAEFCVKAALSSLLKEGQQVFLVKDAVAAVDSKTAEQIFKMLSQRGLKFITVEELVKRLT